MKSTATTEPAVGSTRLVRCDEHNIACQVYRVVNAGKENERREWVEEGYYGSNLRYACTSALYLSMPIGEVITPAMICGAVEKFMGVCA